MNRMMFPLKSLLFIPGNQINMLEKALGLAPDAFVPDMEDSIPQPEKLAARQMKSVKSVKKLLLSGLFT